MLIAKKGASRVRAEPGQEAQCPYCKGEVFSRCGEVNVWHWAHKTLGRCDPWKSPESEWHRAWKMRYATSQTEVVIEKHGIRHIADVALIYGNKQLGLFESPRYFVIELQNSQISPEQIRERETFYETMAWIFNLQDCYPDRLMLFDKVTYWTFLWKYPRKSILTAKKPLIFDFDAKSDKAFLVKKTYCEQTPYGGWGHMVEKKSLENFDAFRLIETSIDINLKAQIEIMFDYAMSEDLPWGRQKWVNTIKEHYDTFKTLTPRQYQVLRSVIYGQKGEDDEHRDFQGYDPRVA